MKVIDLLNKIANGEDVPKEIRLGDKIDIFYYQDDIKSYKTYENEYLMCEYLCNTDRLNDEVEIIEEEKKIPEKLNIYNYDESDIMYKVNEIIDYLKSKGE